MMRERAKFWMLLNSLSISFFWVDSDVVITRNINTMLLRPDVKLSDMAFQHDGRAELTTDERIFRHHNHVKNEGETGSSWMEPCGGFFFARATKATGDFFLRVDTAMTLNPDVF